MDNFEEQEKEIRRQLDESMEVLPFEEKFAQIESRLDMELPRGKAKKKPVSRSGKLFTVAASVALLAVFGVVMFFVLKPGVPEEPVYLDDDIKFDMGQLEELTSMENIYLPDLSILSIQTVNVGRYIETNEAVYFVLTGIYEDELSFREVETIVVLKKEYSGSRIKDYTILPEVLTIGEKQINYNAVGYDEPFYTYYVGYASGDVRYYFNYHTIEEDDLAEFFGPLLK